MQSSLFYWFYKGFKKYCLVLSEISWLHILSGPSLTFALMSLFWSIWTLRALQFRSLWVFILSSGCFLLFAFSQALRCLYFYLLPPSQMLILCSSCDFSCFLLPISILVFVGIACHLVLLQVFFNAFEFCYPDLSLWVDLD